MAELGIPGPIHAAAKSILGKRYSAKNPTGNMLVLHTTAYEHIVYVGGNASLVRMSWAHELGNVCEGRMCYFDYVRWCDMQGSVAKDFMCYEWEDGYGFDLPFNVERNWPVVYDRLWSDFETCGKPRQPSNQKKFQVSVLLPVLKCAELFFRERRRDPHIEKTLTFDGLGDSLAPVLMRGYRRDLKAEFRALVMPVRM